MESIVGQPVQVQMRVHQHYTMQVISPEHGTQTTEMVELRIKNGNSLYIPFNHLTWVAGYGWMYRP